MAKQKAIQISDVTINPGEYASLALPLPEIFSCAPMYMPMKVIHGTTTGPTILVFSTIKGNEFNGLEIANRFIETIDAKKLAGTVITIPVLNVYGLAHYPNQLPAGMDKQIDNCFPGREDGNFGERFAHVLSKYIMSMPSVVIELQTGGVNHNILPQVYCNLQDHKSTDLAKAFNTPVITNVDARNNKLRQDLESNNKTLLVYQAGEAMRFDEHSIELGVHGIQNVMAKLGMLDFEPEENMPVFSEDTEWFRANQSGIYYSEVSLGQKIKAGDHLGIIKDPFSANINQKVIAENDGIVVGINSSPLVHEGMEIIKVATFTNNKRAEVIIEKWDDEQPESYIN